MPTVNRPRVQDAPARAERAIAKRADLSFVKWLRRQLLREVLMNRMLSKLTIAILIGGLLFSNPTSAQLPPANRVAHVQITKGPELESARSNWAIIRWTSNNPGGTDEHWGVVHYG